MRSTLICSILLLLLSACKDQKRSKNATGDVIDTTMAELLKEPPIPAADSLQIINFWKHFRELLLKNDTNELTQLSLKYVYCPVYQNHFNNYRHSSIVPLYFFQQAPYRNDYITAFAPSILKDTPVIIAGKLDSRELADLSFRQDEKLSSYSLLLTTKENKGHYILNRSHLFQFVKINDSLKFMGLNVDENGSVYQYKLISCDSLYFPLCRKGQDSAINSNTLDTITNKYYSMYLADCKEPNLYTDKSGDEIYRFTWIRAFHNPVVIRFQKHNNLYTLYTKELANNRGYIPQKILINNETALTVHEWENFKVQMDDLGFWDIISNDPFPRPPIDGASWILEAAIKKKYHFAERESPENQKKFKSCCKYLLSLTQLKIPEKDQY